MSLRAIGRQVMARQCRPANTPLPRMGSTMSGPGMGGGSYEGDGKTTVTIINKDMAGYLLVDAYARHGFRLSNGLFALGPIALFPSTVLQWDIASVDDIDEKSLSLFTLVEPRLEVLVIGVGEDGLHNQMSSDLNRRVRAMLTQKKINCEIMPTKHAVTTYNFMCVDHRVCAGAFIPPFVADADDAVDGFFNPQPNNRFISSHKQGVS